MALFFTEWCDENGFDYFDPDARTAWERYCQAEYSRPAPKSSGDLCGGITRTWREDRADELLRRAKNTFYKVIWPKEAIKILKARPRV
jgi:hypothetical protein